MIYRRQFEGQHLKSHQDLMNKGVELSGIITRLKSQLAHEKQSTTATSECSMRVYTVLCRAYVELC